MSVGWYDHEFVSDVTHDSTSSEGKCEADRVDRNGFAILDHEGKPMKCGASWSSALHPPDQFRHWCSVLEAGGDCMHFED